MIKHRNINNTILSVTSITLLSLLGANTITATFAQASSSADDEIKKKLDELMREPNSSLNKMKTFEHQDEEQKPLLRPLSAVIGSDIDLQVSRATPFSEQFIALLVRVENKSDKTVIIDGDRASLNNGDNQNDKIICVPQSQIDQVGRPPTTAKAKITSDFKKTVAAALTVGAVPTAETIITEHGPIRKRYEWDEQRREHEESRFGKRLLYPGDKSDGVIYFNSSVSLNQRALTIPVKSFYDGADQTALVKPIPLAVYSPQSKRH